MKNYIDLLKRYANLYDKGNYLSIGESQLYSEVKNTPELADIVKKIDSLPTLDEKYKAIEQYEASLTQQNQNDLDQIKSGCEKAFGIKIDNIEFKHLSNGKDIIAFFDPKYGRKRLIDYSYAKSLTGEFTNIQNNNETFQTDDYEQNANNIAKSEANQNPNREFAMIDIEQFKLNYKEIMSRIPANEQYKVEMINQLLNQSELRNIKYINIENMVALDKDGNIIEAYKTSSLNGEQVQVGGTTSYSENVSSIDNSGNVEYNSSYSNIDSSVNEDGITLSEFEQEDRPKTPEEIAKEEDFKKIIKEEIEKRNLNISVDVEYRKIKGYLENLEQLEQDYARKKIDDNQYEFYKELCNSYTKTNSLNNKNTLTLTYEREQAGYVTIFIISFVVIMISILALLLINF